LADTSTVCSCEALSFTDTRANGIRSEWTRNLVAVGDREILSGEVVELCVRIEDSECFPDETFEIRFDIFEEDFVLTGGSDDHIAAFTSDNVEPTGGTVEAEMRSTSLRIIGPDKSCEEGLNDFVTANPDTYEDHILILKTADTPVVCLVVTWWRAERLKDILNSEYFFTIEVKDLFQDKAAASLDVSSTPIGRVEGMLTDGGGALLAGQSAKLLRACDNQMQAAATVDASGCFCFAAVPAGAYRLVVEGHEISIGPVKIPGTITGVLTDETGNALAGKTVTLLDGSDKSVAATSDTNSSGSFTFEAIPVGAYMLAVGGYVLDLGTAKATGGVGGTILDPAGVPLPGVGVRLLRTDGSIHTSTTSDISGSFQFDGVPVGSYMLAVDGYGVSLEPVPGVSPVVGVLRDTSGNRLPGLAVRFVRSSDNGLQGTATTDAKGAFSLATIPGGEYRVSIDGCEIDTEGTLSWCGGTVEDFIGLVRETETLNPDSTGEDILNGLRRITGAYDDEFFRRLYGGVARGPVLNTGGIRLHELRGMMCHGEIQGTEIGLVTDRFGHDVAMGHVLTGISGGQHRIEDLDLVPWYTMFIGGALGLLISLTIGEELDNLYAVTISGDLGQSAYLIAEGLKAPPYVGPKSEATHAEMTGDIDGVLIGKNLEALCSGRSLFEKPAKSGARLSEVLSEYYDKADTEVVPDAVRSRNRFQLFYQEDFDYLDAQTKAFAVMFAYKKKVVDVARKMKNEEELSEFLEQAGDLIKGGAEAVFGDCDAHCEETLKQFRGWLEGKRYVEIQRARKG
jgi:hypothetical protein